MASGGVNVSVRIDIRQLERLANDIPKRVDRGIAHIAYAVEKGAVKAAPVDTGSLRSSIHVNKLAQSTYEVKPNVAGEDGAPYDAFQEYGTGMRAEDWNGNAVSSRHVIVARGGLGSPAATKSGQGWSLGRARGVKPMIFEWHGAKVVAWSVQGVHARHYMGRGLAEAMFQIPRLFAEGFVSLGI